MIKNYFQTFILYFSAESAYSLWKSNFSKEKIIFQKLAMSFSDYNTINILHTRVCICLFFFFFIHNINLQKILFNFLLDQTTQLQLKKQKK